MEGEGEDGIDFLIEYRLQQQLGKGRWMERLGWKKCANCSELTQSFSPVETVTTCSSKQVVLIMPHYFEHLHMCSN